MLEPQLKSKINKLWDKFWAGGLANPLTAIEQVSYLIFMKRLEDMDNLRVKRHQARKEEYESIFQDNEDCRWSHFKHFNAEDMLTHVRDKVFPFFKTIKKANGDNAFAKQMQDAVFMIPKPSLLQEAVSIIDELDITARNQDVQGDIYEYLLSELNQAGRAGQFRTPRHIIRMMVDIINPKLGEKVLDPACGTGGFFLAAYDFITNNSALNKDEKKFLKFNTFSGWEIVANTARLCLMNLYLHLKNPFVLNRVNLVPCILKVRLLLK